MTVDLMERLRLAFTSACNDDTTIAGTVARERHIARLDAIYDAISTLRRLRTLLADIHRTSPKAYRLDKSGLTHGQAAEIGTHAMRAAIQERVDRSGEETSTWSGWMPISSAPTNRAIQIHVPSLDYYGNGGVYAGMLVDMGTGRRWMTFGWAIGRDLGHENTPTHWRSLPLPPPGRRGGGGQSVSAPPEKLMAQGSEGGGLPVAHHPSAELAPPVPDDLTRDPRPACAGWQPGNQVRRCPKCDGRFRGGPQARECANCAYGEGNG